MRALGAAFIVLASVVPARAGEVAVPPNDTLAHVLASGKLHWGMDAQGGAPYVFQSPMDPNLIIGFEVDLADAIARRLHVQAVPVQGQWEQLLDLLQRGDFDIALNGLEVADEKRRVCDLSHPYFAAAERLTIRRGDKKAPRTMAELRGRSIGTLPGSLAERILIRAGAIPKTYEGGQNEIYDDLKIGRTDGVLLDEPITHYFADIEPSLKVVDGSFGEVQYAIAVRKGDARLLAALNQSIDALAADGTLRKIYEKWGIWTPETARLFHQDPTPDAGVAEAFESWRVAVGKLPPFSERLLHRYPKTFRIFGRAALITLVISVASMGLAIALGLFLAFARVFGSAPLRWGATTYIEFFRGTPLLIQLIMIYFGLPELGVTLNPFVAGWLALGMNYAAAEAENYRTGILSIPAGQLDAAKVLGLTRWQTLRHIVSPQAMRIALPPVTNDFIALLKDSSLISIVTVTELTKAYGNLANSTRDHLGLGVIVAIWYLIIGLPFARLARLLEARLGRHLRPIG